MPLYKVLSIKQPTYVHDVLSLIRKSFGIQIHLTPSFAEPNTSRTRFSLLLSMIAINSIHICVIPEAAIRGVLCKNGVLKFHKIHWKTPVPESFF